MSTPRTVSDQGIALIKEFEGFPDGGRPYLDRLARPHVWTRGYGRTEGIGPNSPRISEAAAGQELKDLLAARYLPTLWALPVTLNQSQLDALASFIWNVGTGGVASSTGVGRALRRHDWAGAADHLLEWDKAGGRALLGLTRRRHAERALFLKAGQPDRWAGYKPDELRWMREIDKHPRLPRRIVLRRVMRRRAKQLRALPLTEVRRRRIRSLEARS